MLRIIGEVSRAINPLGSNVLRVSNFGCFLFSAQTISGHAYQGAGDGATDGSNAGGLDHLAFILLYCVGHASCTSGPLSSSIEGVGFVNEYLLVQLDSSLDSGDDGSDGRRSDEEVISVGETEFIERVILSSVTRVLVNLLNLVVEQHIVGHVHGVLNAVLLILTVQNLFKVVLREWLEAGSSVSLSTQICAVDVCQEAREEGLEVEASNDGRSTHIASHLHRELVAIVGTHRFSVVVESGG